MPTLKLTYENGDTSETTFGNEQVIQICGVATPLQRAAVEASFSTTGLVAAEVVAEVATAAPAPAPVEPEVAAEPEHGLDPDPASASTVATTETPAA